MSWLHEWLTRHEHQGKSLSDTVREISELRRGLRRKDVVDTSQDELIRMMEIENGELRLYLAAMIWLLLDKKVVGQDELVKVVEMIDRSDGRADGRYDGDIAAWGVGES